MNHTIRLPKQAWLRKHISETPGLPTRWTEATCRCRRCQDRRRWSKSLWDADHGKTGAFELSKYPEVLDAIADV